MQGTLHPVTTIVSRENARTRRQWRGPKSSSSSLRQVQVLAGAQALEQTPMIRLGVTFCNFPRGTCRRHRLYGAFFLSLPSSLHHTNQPLFFLEPQTQDWLISSAVDINIYISSITHLQSFHLYITTPAQDVCPILGNINIYMAI